MRKIFFLVMIGLILVSSMVYADGLYFSLRPIVCLDNFNFGGEHLTLEMQESWGINAKLGKVLGVYTSLELDIDYLFGFESVYKGDYEGVYYYLKSEAKFFTIMPMVKWSDGNDKYKNYFSTGLGYMRLESHEEANISIVPYEIAKSMDLFASKSDVCWKLGIGLDYFFKEKASLDAEAGYVVGLGDLKDIEYWNLSLGIAFFF